MAQFLNNVSDALDPQTHNDLIQALMTLGLSEKMASTSLDAMLYRAGVRAETDLEGVTASGIMVLLSLKNAEELLKSGNVRAALESLMTATAYYPLGWDE